MQIELKVVKGIKKSLISQIQPLSRAEVTDKNFIKRSVKPTGRFRLWGCKRHANLDLKCTDE